MKRIGHLKSLFAVGLVAMATSAAAQPGQVKILVGFPAGGAPDAVARAFADQLRLANGATVIVENRPGASGKIAIDALSSAGDGDTVALIPSSVLALVPQIVKSAKFDAVKDFVAFGSVAEYGFGIAAGPASGATSISAYKDWAKQHPKESSYATPGPGTPQHFLGAQLQKLLGIELTHVPYKGGAAAVGDVIGGTVPLLITTEQLLVPYEGQGKIKALLTTSRQRNPKMPQVPTAKEIGLPQLESTDWFGIFGKANTSPAKVTEWRAQVAKITSNPQFIDTMKNMGYDVPKKQPSDFAQLISSERTAWTERVKLSGFSAVD